MSDGIDVILDQWSLEDGHDVNAFMEKMVSDPSIKRVVIVSDSVYASKANARKGGVGTETQIISEEVYDSVDQNKFIPILKERDEKGVEFLPIYLKSRKYIDFSDTDQEADAYDQLVRNIFERPKRRKPVLGKPPAHLFDELANSVSSAQKAKRFREIVTSGKGAPALAFDDFTSDFISNLEELRITYSSEKKATWCEEIRNNIATSILHRDVCVDVIAAAARSLPGEEFMPQLVQFLEKILPFTKGLEGLVPSFDVSEDNFKFIVYELFLYSIAALILTKKYDGVRLLLTHRYVAPTTYGGTKMEAHDFTDFNQYAKSLEEFCSQQGNSRRLSVMADLIYERATRKDIRYSDVFQVEALLCLAMCGRGWYPRSMIYSRKIGTLELFLRAETHDGFQPLATMLGMRSQKELIESLESECISRMFRSSAFFLADVSLDPFNYSALKRMWGGK